MLLSLAVVVLTGLAAAPALLVETVFPPTGSVVPTNARVVVFGESSLTFSLERGDGGVEPVTVERFANRSNLLLLPALLADEAIAVSVDTIGGVRFDWTAGDADDVNAPVVGDGKLGVIVSRSNDDPFFVEACLPPLVSDEQVVVHVVGEAIAFDAFAQVHDCFNELEGVGVGFFLEGDQQDEACLDFSVVDVAGNESAPETVCTDLDPLSLPAGCAQAAPSTSWLLALLGLGLVRRRRG